MTTDILEPWEKWPVAALVAAAGLNTAIWYAGDVLPIEARGILPWLITIAAIASVVAIDGALIATVAGMRLGRRNRWSAGNIMVTALFTALAALSAHDAVLGIAPWLHGLFAITIVMYPMHLSMPRVDVGIALALREQELTRREQDVNQRIDELSKLHQAHVTIVNTFQAGIVNEPDKRQLIRQLVDSGVSITAAAKQHGVTRQTASKYINEVDNNA